MARPTKATVDYFPHSVSHGKTMTILEAKYGNDGYAFWFKLLEMLGNSDGLFLDLSDDMTLEFLAAKTRMDIVSAGETLDLLARCGAIDPELWSMRVVYSQNFVDGVSDAFRKRKGLLPSKTTVLNSFRGGNDDKRDNPAEETGKEKEKEKEKPSSSPTDDGAPKSPYTETFEQFWAVYPKKVGKGEAFKAFQKAKLGNGRLQPIIDALEAQKRSSKWKEENGRYIPNPSTWINQRRWDDELETTAVDEEIQRNMELERQAREAGLGWVYDSNGTEG